MKINLDRTDVYPKNDIPEADVETAMKVLHTLRNMALDVGMFNARLAATLSHTHKELYRLAELHNILEERDAKSAEAAPNRQG